MMTVGGRREILKSSCEHVYLYNYIQKFRSIVGSERRVLNILVTSRIENPQERRPIVLLISVATKHDLSSGVVTLSSKKTRI